MTRRALIVGASGGIGRAVATRLGGEGWRILAHGRSAERIAETVAAVEAAGGTGASCKADVTNPEEVAALAEWAAADGPLDAVVWTAGGGRSVATSPDAIPEWDRTLAATLHAPMRLTALTLASVRQAGGAYLYVCGMYAKIGVARLAAHCAGRHGLEGFAKALFEEVREDGVRVALLHPGYVNTSLATGDRLDPARMIQPADVAAMAAMALTLPATACITEMVVRPQRSPYRAV